MPLANIVLTGFMGTGKSSVGRLLAATSGRSFVDTDEYIVERAGRSIADIFEIEGEQRFREMESDLALELSGREELVIASGGRMMLDPLNALSLAGNAIVICLTAAPEEILSRLAGDDERRPLLETANPAASIRRLLDERSEGYGQFPQVTTTGKSVTEVADEVMTLVGEAIAAGRRSTELTSRIQVRHPGGQYTAFVGRSLLPEVGRCPELPGPAVLVTDSTVGPLYQTRLCAADLRATITIAAGEEHKTLENVRVIYDHLLAAGIDRQGAVISLGGGVIGDMAGFAAASYMRGITFVPCPTTVLAMVDASVGGKTGVDLPQGKNLVGAFKQPGAVVADLGTLKTLPEAVFAAGMAEVVKHGMIAGTGLLERVDSVAWNERRLRPDGNLQSLIVEAILVKRDVVQSDPFEAGRRRILNLGHTFAHAIEQVSNFSVPHGQAVAIGLVAAATLSANLGYCSPELPERITDLLTHLNLPVQIPAGLSGDALLSAMQADKKMAAGKLNFVLLREVGDVFVTDDVPEPAVRSILGQLMEP
jgi:shikimate kinase/3-dehydroquinate synthase